MWLTELKKGKYLFNATKIIKDNTNLSNLETCKILKAEVESLTLETKERINKNEFLKIFNLINEKEEEMER